MIVKVILCQKRRKKYHTLPTCWTMYFLMKLICGVCKAVAVEVNVLFVSKLCFCFVESRIEFLGFECSLFPF